MRPLRKLWSANYVPTNVRITGLAEDPHATSVFVKSDASLISLKSTTGDRQWQFDVTDTRRSTAPWPIYETSSPFNGGLPAIYFTAGQKLYALDADSGKLLGSYAFTALHGREPGFVRPR